MEKNHNRKKGLISAYFHAIIKKTNEGGIEVSNEITYQIMHMNRIVAVMTTHGKAHIFDEAFMPYDLWFDTESDDLDSRVNNITNFHYWCASRVLTIDRKYAKEIFNSIGAAQNPTDRDRANVSLSYHCVSLTDVYWVREANETITFEEMNLYDNTLNEAVVEISLRGKQLTVTNAELTSYDFAPELSTRGVFPKAWIRCEDGFKLLKDGNTEAVERELLASAVCQCFDIPQVRYTKGSFQHVPVTESTLITSKETSIISKAAFDIYAANHDLDTVAVASELDPITYYGMNILDYLIGNTDRHSENWGFMIDNKTNRYVSLYPLMDFNQSFGAYDTIDGAMCLPVFPKRMTQREAALEGVRKIGLRQIHEVDMDIFGERTAEAEMFRRRLAELKKAVNE